VLGTQAKPALAPKQSKLNGWQCLEIRRQKQNMRADPLKETGTH
jgi:hypothetical protein